MSTYRDVLELFRVHSGVDQFSPPLASTYSTLVTGVAGVDLSITDDEEFGLAVNYNGVANPNADRIKLALKSKSHASSYTVTARFRAHIHTDCINTGCGIAVRDSSGGKIITFGVARQSGGNGEFEGNIWNSPTSFLTTISGVAGIGIHGPWPEWFRMVWDTSTFKYYYSFDGKHWLRMADSGPGFTPNQLGFFVRTNTNLTLTGDWCAMTVQYLVEA